MLVLPYSAESHHAIGAAELAQMKPTATLVNIARGGIVDDAALAQALREQRIAAAGLDVFEGEPKVHPDLLTVPNVVLTPHIASATVPTRRAMADLAADNLIGFLVHGKPLTPLNPEVLEDLVEIWIVMALALASVVLLVALLLRKPPVADTGRAELLAANERLERELRREISESSRGAAQRADADARDLPATPGAAGGRGDAHAERADRCLLRSSSDAAAEDAWPDTAQTSRSSQSRCDASPNARRLRRSARDAGDAARRSCSRPTRPSSRRCAAPSTRSCRPRWRRAWARASSRWPSGWSRCTRAWARCRRWRRAWATCSAC